MPLFRKKPVVIEAWVWDETQETLLLLMEKGMKYGGYESHAEKTYVRNLTIQTLEGSMRANKGDYIINGVKGEFYPCKPDIFEATYERTE